MTLTEAKANINRAEVVCPSCPFNGNSDCGYCCSVRINADEAYDTLAEVSE